MINLGFLLKSKGALVLKFFSPTAHFVKITEILPDHLDKLCVDTLIIDIDNTLKPYGTHTLACEYSQWLELLLEKGYKVVLCSNNYKRNVSTFAESLGIPFVSMALKPSPLGFIRAVRKMKSKRKNCIVIGDQLFTDIFGAELSFMKSILIEPIEPEKEGKTVKLRRALERRRRGTVTKRKNPF